MAGACMGVGLVPYASVGIFLIVNVWAERRGTSLVHSMTNEIEGFALKQYPNMSVKIELRKPI
jgi:hypothetical protein